MKRTSILAAIAAMAIGCSSGGGGGGGGTVPAPQDPTMATVRFAVKFPSAGMTSIIDPGAESIVVHALDEASFTMYGPVTLTRLANTGTLVLPIGSYVFMAEELDGAGTLLESSFTAGKVLAGSNSVVISLLSGEWTLGTPVVLSNGVQVTGFEVSYVDSSANGYANAFETSIPAASNGYGITYRLEDPVLGALNGVSRIRHITQFGGGTVNRSGLDGGGYDLDAQCGEQQDGPYAGSCSNDGPPTPDHKWIRILGPMETGGCRDCGPGYQAIQDLLPPQQFYPDLRPLANARVVSGSQIAGTLIEYQFAMGSSQLIESAGPLVVPPPPAAPPLVPDAAFATTITEFRTAIVCRDGLNGQTPDGSVDYGTWRLEGAQDPDFDGTVDYWDNGWPEGNMGPPLLGECTYGLEPATSDLGEWCDGWWDSFAHTCVGPGDGVAMPFEFVDQNADGVVDVGSFYHRFVAKQQFQVYGQSYSFTAAGVALDRTTTIVIQ